jgi:hypothetical protein
MPTDQCQDPFWSGLTQRQIAEPIHDLVADLSGLENGGGPFNAKDLFNALPPLAKPVIEIWTTRDAAVL